MQQVQTQKWLDAGNRNGSRKWSGDQPAEQAIHNQRPRNHRHALDLTDLMISWNKSRVFNFGNPGIEYLDLAKPTFWPLFAERKTGGHLTQDKSFGGVVRPFGFESRHFPT